MTLFRMRSRRFTLSGRQARDLAHDWRDTDERTTSLPDELKRDVQSIRTWHESAFDRRYRLDQDPRRDLLQLCGFQKQTAGSHPLWVRREAPADDLRDAARSNSSTPNGRTTMPIIDFHCAYSAVSGKPTQDLVPSVTYDSENHTVRVTSSVWWNFLEGHHHDSSASPIFEPNEVASDEQIREWVRDAGGDVFAIVAIEDWTDHGYDDASGDRVDPDAIGWAVIYRNAGAVPG